MIIGLLFAVIILIILLSFAYHIGSDNMWYDVIDKRISLSKQEEVVDRYCFEKPKNDDRYTIDGSYDSFKNEKPMRQIDGGYTLDGSHNYYPGVDYFEEDEDY